MPKVAEDEDKTVVTRAGSMALHLWAFHEGTRHSIFMGWCDSEETATLRVHALCYSPVGCWPGGYEAMIESPDGVWKIAMGRPAGDFWEIHHGCAPTPATGAKMSAEEIMTLFPRFVDMAAEDLFEELNGWVGESPEAQNSLARWCAQTQKEHDKVFGDQMDPYELRIRESLGKLARQTYPKFGQLCYVVEPDGFGWQIIENATVVDAAQPERGWRVLLPHGGDLVRFTIHGTSLSEDGEGELLDKIVAWCIPYGYGADLRELLGKGEV